ncbi:VOC family protein [Rummeliibacillus stabekisii]|uniref:Glyoxalase n=1 Tax=Rummeliibacillus stabekisii TaxID=241244 RepID=A0A143HED2_9BACL|nr:VOC family protein [Rummeliibacillus stabekisii]AMW99840.1 glyoxalase [Rummeliibacillus stabekisii]
MLKRYIHHLCIQTNTYKESLVFYTKALGFEVVEETPKFHGRAFNTWLKLGDFYIELQTGKFGEKLVVANSNSEGLVHFCLWVENLPLEVERLKELKSHFILKDGEIIYHVENGSLCKVKAPEGTIVELRTNKGI